MSYVPRSPAYKIGERPNGIVSKENQDTMGSMPPLAICSHRYERTEEKDGNGTIVWRCRCGAVKISM